MSINDITPYSYSWFYHWYHAQIASYMDSGVQKDYYKGCEYVALWFNRVRGNGVLLIFFKDNVDFDNSKPISKKQFLNQKIKKFSTMRPKFLIMTSSSSALNQMGAAKP